MFSNYHAFSEEIEEYLELDLMEMYDNKLIGVDVKELCLYIIYANYQANTKAERAKIIYDYMVMDLFQRVKIKEAFCLGVEPILDEKTFWRQYLMLLSLEEGDREYALLKEAIEETGNHWEIIFDLPSQIYQKHPKLFFDYLNFLKDIGDDEKIVSVGDNILRKLDENLVVRSKMACIVAESLVEIGNLSYINDYFYQIFVSNSNSINLLRVLLYQDCFF